MALGAIAGILLGEGIWRLVTRGQSNPTADSTLAIALALFLTMVAVFIWRPRPWLCWTIIIGGFATLHLFQNSVVPAIVLAQALTPAAGQDPAQLQAVQAIGRIVDDPHGVTRNAANSNTAAAPPEIGDWHFTFQLESISVAGQQWPCHAQTTAFWKNAAHKPITGERLDVLGLAGNIAAPRNPGEFDDQAYLRRRGIYSELTMNGIADVSAAPNGSTFWERPMLGPSMQRVHDWIDATLRLDLADEPDVARLVTTVLLGLRDYPGLGDLEPLFQRTGTLHFFAIDGLKIGFLGWILLAALSSVGLPRKWARALCLLLLLGYTLAAGVGPATVRAVALAAILLGGEWLDRPARAGNSLGAAAVGLLLFDTNQLFTLGFQLSFLVVLAILTLTPLLHAVLLRVGASDPFLPRLLFSRWQNAREAARRTMVDLTSVAIAAWVGSLPLTILAFHLISPISILANVIVFPLAAAMFGLAVFSVLGAILWQTWAVWMNNANLLVAKTLLAALRLFDAIPGSSFHVESPSFWHWPAPTAEITILDLGPGRAIAVRASGTAWLIDTGRTGDYHNVVLPFVQACGLDRLDGLLLTQGDADHLAAAPMVLTDLRPGQVLLPSLVGRSPSLQAVRAMLTGHREPLATATSGTTRTLAPGVNLRVLYPPADLKPSVGSVRTVIVQIQAAGWRVLLLSDSNADAHHWLSNRVPAADLRSDVAVLGQPAESTDEAKFLALINPRLVNSERTREGTGALPKNGLGSFVTQQEAGAVTLRVYPDRMVASEFVPGKEIVLHH